MLQLLCGPLFHLSADGMAGPGDRHLYPLRHLTSLSFVLRHPLCTCETVLSPGHPSASVSHGTHLYTLNIGSACFLSSHPGSIPTLGDLVLSQPRGHLGLLTSPFSYPMSRLCDCVSVTILGVATKRHSFHLRPYSHSRPNHQVSVPPPASSSVLFLWSRVGATPWGPLV